MIIQVLKTVTNYDVLGQPVNLARLNGIDETQKIVAPVTLSFVEYGTIEGIETIVSEQILANDRYFFYEGEKKNIPFADLTAVEISKLNGAFENVE